MEMLGIIARVHKALEQLGTDCAIEEVVGLCPELTWNQVFLAIDYLSRTGQVRLTMDIARTYRVRACGVATAKASRVSLASKIHS